MRKSGERERKERGRKEVRSSRSEEDRKGYRK